VLIIRLAKNKVDAETIFNAFIDGSTVKLDKATKCLRKDHSALLPFYDFPVE
jgi:transposase-like protein